ncbi:hypothetical protein QQF64_011404 [Cirrhinus molitorella]|uniref:Uncharacterized protein n=1 Tax=Cirrhinus molitorella TaxID=172907 RepID=A0ABR3M0Q6_9TELE
MLPPHPHHERKKKKKKGGDCITRRSVTSPRAEMVHMQERIYRGPVPTIPVLTSADARQFSRLRMALENLLPADATERFKYQILTDHLKVEEALLHITCLWSLMHGSAALTW